MGSEPLLQPRFPASLELPMDLRKRLFRDMSLVRRTEEKIRALYAEGNMRCPTHFSIGQEAVSAGVLANLTKDDFAISAHRSHAHYLNKGGDLRAMFAELYGKVDGCASGKGGSMHLIDLDVNFLGCVPIVGSTIPIGTGAAFGAKLQGLNAVTAVFFGDGATETGVFHESLNFAAMHQLRVLFVCENNLYSVNTPLEERQPKGRSIVDLARSHGLTSVQMEGQEVELVYAQARDLIQDIRDGGGPGFIEFNTYRLLEHCGPNEDLQLGFRPKGEFEKWALRCPVTLHRQLLIEDGVTADELDAIEATIDAAVTDALTFAENSPFPPREDLKRFLYADET